MIYELPKLNFAYNALEPFIDAKTMEIHHTKHHLTYTNNLNAVLGKYPAYSDEDLIFLLGKLDSLKFQGNDKNVFKNNAGGYLNHKIFWEIMGPKKELDQDLIERIRKEFNTEDEFKKLFTQTAVTQFGSGWAWLVEDKSKKLKVYSLPNQDSPYSLGDKPLICLDVWEHAYYLKYQNRRAEYVDAWWNVLKLF